MKNRIAAFILAMLLLLTTAAAAESELHIPGLIADITGSEVQESGVQLIQQNLYKETVNNVEITILEAGYDGRTLFLCYSFRMLDVDRPLGVTAKEVYEEDLPEDMDPGSYVDGYMTEDAEELLYKHNVGWWIDDIWFDGKPMDDMPEGSAQYLTGTGTPGELVETDFWRLDQIGVYLEDEVLISLPIGDRQDYMEYSRREHPEKYDESSLLKLPETGMITFHFNAGDILTTNRMARQETSAVLPDVTVRVREAVFTPLMTYVTLDLTVNPDALEAFVAENGEGVTDDDGELLWEYSGMDVFGEWLESLQLADGNGTIYFPDSEGPDMYGDDDAVFLFPALGTLPETLYLAPAGENEKADLNQAVQILPELVPEE